MPLTPIAVKQYIIKLNQTGTNAPVPIVFKNTYNGTPIWSYQGEGEYIVTLTGELNYNKTQVILGANESAAIIQSSEQESPNSIYFSTALLDGSTLSNDLLKNISIQILTYQ